LVENTGLLTVFTAEFWLALTLTSTAIPAAKAVVQANAAISSAAQTNARRVESP
jgi:hypothetical protein